MKVNSKSWMVWLIHSTYDYYRPNNLCKFFWTLVSCILQLPFNFIAHLLNLIKDKDGDPVVGMPAYIGSIIYAVAFLIGAIIHVVCHNGTKMLFVLFNSPLLTLFISGYLMIIGAGIISGVIYLMTIIWHLWEDYMFYVRDKKEADKALHPEKYPAPKQKIKKPNIIWEFLKAKKQKVCPLIEYIND